MKRWSIQQVALMMMMTTIMTIMMTMTTNLASTLAFSAIARGLGVFFPILWQAEELSNRSIGSPPSY